MPPHRRLGAQIAPMLLPRTMPIPTAPHRAAALALLCATTAALALQAPVPNQPDAEEEAGALVGDLMFSADLLTSLDKLCPRGRPKADWHAALPRLPAQATTPVLLDLSRRLGDDAGRRLVQDSGGCASDRLREAYQDSRENFNELIERWQQIVP